MNTVGRPKLPDARNIKLSYSINRKELDLITKAAKKLDVPLSKYVRDAVVEKATGGKK